jgi:hypothetical protein
MSGRLDPERLVSFSPDDLQTIDNVLRDTATEPQTRRLLLKRAALGAVGAAALGVFGPAGSALAAGRRQEVSSMGGDSVATVINTAITAEALAITFLSGVIANVKGPKVTKFKTVLKAANAAEYDHYKALKSLGAKPLTLKFWAPDEFFVDKNVFPTIEVAETAFVNAYLIGITSFSRAGKHAYARYAGEILGTEAEHRALARFAQGKLPNNVGFEAYAIPNMAGIVQALEHAGVGFGKQGSKPGKFYDFAPPKQSVLEHLSHNAPK